MTMVCNGLMLSDAGWDTVLCPLSIFRRPGIDPLTTEAGKLWIVFNGEIYNYQSIREELAANGYHFRSKSDTEVLLYAYQFWGEKCLDKLNGMFAFAIYDVAKRRLFAARDRLGIKPFYYHFEKGRLLFASEIKAILASGLVERRPDLCMLHTPARFLISPQTGFEKICKLPPAHFTIAWITRGEAAPEQGTLSHP
jgi:asparagine synthase (glutamine-hydrolysing)